MTKGAIIVSKEKRGHTFILVEHKRGVARVCVRCGDVRYYGAHKSYKADDFDSGLMIFFPERGDITDKAAIIKRE